MTRSRLSASIALALLIPNVGFAQRAVQLQQGARVRVTAGGRSTVGSLVSITSDSLTVLTEGAASRSTTALATVSRIDVSMGRSHSRGALIGAAVGVSTGILIGALVGAISYSGPDFFTRSRPQAAALVGVVSGIAGLGLGTVVGAAAGIERWATIDKSRYSDAH